MPEEQRISPRLLLHAILTLGGFLALLGVAMFLPAEELEGYKEYAGRVRYRLIPGVW